jgi:hypothetical protein
LVVDTDLDEVVGEKVDGYEAVDIDCAVRMTLGWS